MKYVISYDLSNNRIRTKLAKLLEGYGVRIQYSVFECDLKEKRFQELYKRIFQLTENEEGSVRFYSICASCEQRIVTIGKPMNQLEVLHTDVIII